MASKQKRPQTENQRLHQEIWERAIAKALEEKGANVGHLDYLLDNVLGSKSAMNAYALNPGQLNWRVSTRDSFLRFLGFDSLRAFQESQGPVPTIAPGPQENSVHCLRHALPLRPHICIGREAKLQELRDKLEDTEKGPNIVALYGLGGIGKTTLMQEYLYEAGAQAFFTRIIFVPVNGNLKEAFIKGASDALALNAERLPMQEDRLALVTDAMQQLEGQNLFVVDNINEADYDDLMAMERVFRQTRWNFLITTRSRSEAFVEVHTDELDDTSAKLLFAYHYASPDNPKDWGVKEWGGFIEANKLENEIGLLLFHINKHTLLIELLAKVGRKKGIGVTDLLRHLQEQDILHPELQRNIYIGSHSHSSGQLSNGTIANYMLSLFDTDHLMTTSDNEVENLDNEAKVTILRFFSLMPYEDIKIDNLITLWDIQKNEIIPFENHMDDLQQVGWLQQKKERVPQYAYLSLFSYKMHYLVQKVIFEKLKPNTGNCQELLQHLKGLLKSKTCNPKMKTYIEHIMLKLKPNGGPC